MLENCLQQMPKYWPTKNLTVRAVRNIGKRTDKENEVTSAFRRITYLSKCQETLL